MTENPETTLVLRIFQEAWALPAKDRPAFLSAACEGNPELLFEVEKLFQKMEETESGFLETTGAPGADRIGDDACLAEGTEIGRYRILRPIGKGGMGEVYLAARITDYRAEVAVKVARRDSGHATLRFQRERQILATLDHPHICRLLDGGSLATDDRQYLVMEYVKGHLLHEYCDRKELGYEERVSLLIQLCQAVEAFHQKNVIHRDLSPNNVMATDEGGVKVMDFGLASFNVTDAEGPTQDALTLQLGVGVTLPYASPEQIMFDGSQPLDARTDIYMLGTLMYRLFCGQPPFDGLSRQEQIEAIRNKEPVRPRRIKPNMPLDLETVCLKCLEKDADRRYQKAAELSQDLERFLRNEPVKARRPSLLERTNRWRQRNRVLFALAVILLAVVGVGIGSTAAALRQAWAFQATSQDMLVKLSSALNESYFLNPSPYTFEQDFRQALARDIAPYAVETLENVEEAPGTRPLHAAMHTQLALRDFNENRKTEGTRHYQESLRLWRQAINDDPQNVHLTRSLAITFSFYADSTSTGVKTLSDFELRPEFVGFSYDGANDRAIAAAVATLWNQKAQAFADTGVYHQEAFGAAQFLWTKLISHSPKNEAYLRGYAVARHQHGIAIERLGKNLAQADVEFTEARTTLRRLQAAKPLALSDLRLLADATWHTANINLRKLDWGKGRVLLDEALSLGSDIETRTNGSLESIAFLSDIQWHTIEEMKPSPPEGERLELVKRFHDHLLELMHAEKITELDSARLGACQFILAVANKRDVPSEATGRRLRSASRNLTWGVDHVKESRDKWLTWRSQVYLELGDLNLASLPQTRKEYYAAAQADAQAAIDAYSRVKEPLNMVYFAKDRLDAIKKDEAQAMRASTNN